MQKININSLIIEIQVKKLINFKLFILTYFSFEMSNVETRLELIFIGVT